MSDKKVFWGFMVIFLLLMYWYIKNQPKPTKNEKGEDPKIDPNTANTGTTQAKPPTVPTPTQQPPSVPNVATVPQANKQLNTGSSGQEVQQLQTLLKSKGFKDVSGKELVVDGSYGSKTKYAHDSAILACKNAGIDVDRSYQQLNAALNPSANNILSYLGLQYTPVTPTTTTQTGTAQAQSSGGSVGGDLSALWSWLTTPLF